ADRNRSHRSISKTPSYTKSVSWQHHPSIGINNGSFGAKASYPDCFLFTFYIEFVPIIDCLYRSI
ncbi:TPA: hypothetical protein ACU2FX_004493, partial [Escherichia coli]